MINELHNLAKALDAKGVQVPEWHRKYKEMPKVTPKSLCIRIWLDDDGAVCGIESLASEHVSNFRKYGDNQSSFPAFNISSLYRIVDQDIIDELEQLEAGQIKPDIGKMKVWSNVDNWIKGVPGKVQRSLTECPKNLSEMLHLEGQSKNNIIARLAELCQKNCENAANSFRASLENYAFEKLKKGEDTAVILTLLFHKGSAEKEHDKDTGSNISVILDVRNWQPYGYPIASAYTTNQLNKMLLASNSQGAAEIKSEQTDAFGTPFVNPDETMPNVKLSGFDITLRSMFDGQPCQYRYGRINDGSYPIAAANRSSIKSALEWIADSSHRQVTWEKIDKNEIVFVYPSKLPEIPPKFVSIFGHSPSEHAIQSEERFESIAKEFLKTMRGLPTDQKPDIMQIFTIRKIDNGRSKVIFTHNSTLEHLIRGAEDWSIGCHNLPQLDIDEPTTPFPLDVADIVNAVWKQNGERADGKTPVKRMKYYQGMELLLDILPSDAIQNFLHIQIENTSGLVYYLGNKLHRGGKCDNNAEFRRLDTQKGAVTQIYSLLGLLLFKCNVRKENYMEGLAYLLGHLLHVSDELHLLYCKVKRNGDIPPQLVGSALFISAGEMPYQALSQLATRMNPYISWAKQYRYKNNDKQGEESWRAGWLLSLFEQISNQIMPQMDRSIRFGAFEKAQLFIGYMASLPKKERSDETMESTEITGGMDNE
ncbi:MAG: hypothetical protein ACYDG2_06880 [Ruminiclostridium sp.]